MQGREGKQWWDSFHKLSQSQLVPPLCKPQSPVGTGTVIQAALGVSWSLPVSGLRVSACQLLERAYRIVNLSLVHPALWC